MRRLRTVVTAVLATALLVVLAPSLASPVDAQGSGRTHDFPDVPDASPFHDNISWLAGEGYVTGYSDGTYRPGTEVTRQAVVQILWRMSGEPGTFGGTEPFVDVTPSHPFYDAIVWAWNEGIIGIYPDGTFRSTDPIARQSLGHILHELSGIENTYGGSVPFSDVPLGYAFRGDISWWYRSGQAEGYSDGTFRPKDSVTRQSLARFLDRYYQMMGGYWPYTDHRTHVCDEPVTSEQQAIGDQLLADVEDAIAAQFPTKAAAMAAGYRIAAPPFGGEGSHLVNDDYSSDGIFLDPTKPESLVLGPDDNTVEAAMFVREYVGPGPVWPPEPAGCLTKWHAHDNLCYSAPFLSGGHVTMIANFAPCGANLLRITPEMLHVWIDGRADPFEGIET